MSFTTGVLVDVCYFNILFQILLASDFSFFRNQIGPTPFFFFINKDSLKHSRAHYASAMTRYDGRVRPFKHKALCSYRPALCRRGLAELWFKARRYRGECALFCTRPLLHHLRETKTEKARVAVGKPLCRIEKWYSRKARFGMVATGVEITGEVKCLRRTASRMGNGLDTEQRWKEQQEEYKP